MNNAKSKRLGIEDAGFGIGYSDQGFGIQDDSGLGIRD
jgi:hypothetical protein